MKWMRVQELQRGMTIERTGVQTLWDASVSPWREFGAGSRLEVLRVRRMPTGRTDRQPFEVRLQEVDTGAVLALEVSDGLELVLTDENGPDG